jgi:hypothetical protein
LGVLSSIVIRVVLAIFSAFHLEHVERVPYWTGFSGSITGWIVTANEKVRARSDYSLPFWLGLLELYTYPILIATDALSIIGAWIAFKAVAQWGGWREQRVTFNRFLLGNALVVVIAYLLSRYVSV